MPGWETGQIACCARIIPLLRFMREHLKIVHIDKPNFDQRHSFYILIQNTVHYSYQIAMNNVWLLYNTFLDKYVPRTRTNMAYFWVFFKCTHQISLTQKDQCAQAHYYYASVASFYHANGPYHYNASVAYFYYANWAYHASETSTSVEPSAPPQWLSISSSTNNFMSYKQGTTNK